MREVKAKDLQHRQVVRVSRVATATGQTDAVVLEVSRCRDHLDVLLDEIRRKGLSVRRVEELADQISACCSELYANGREARRVRLCFDDNGPSDPIEVVRTFASQETLTVVREYR